jgi:hypothetical protein
VTGSQFSCFIVWHRVIRATAGRAAAGLFGYPHRVNEKLQIFSSIADYGLNRLGWGSGVTDSYRVGDHATT